MNIDTLKLKTSGGEKIAVLNLSRNGKRTAFLLTDVIAFSLTDVGN